MKLPDNIHGRLRRTYILLATIPLIIVGLVLTWITYTTQFSQVLALQKELALRVGTQVEAKIFSLESLLSSTAQVTRLDSRALADQEDILQQLLNNKNQTAFLDISLLDAVGKELHFISKQEFRLEKEDRSTSAEYGFFIRHPDETVYYGQVQFTDPTHQPYMVMAVPLKDPRTDDLRAILVATVLLDDISILIDDLDLNDGDHVYIVQNDVVIAHPNRSVTLQDTFFTPPANIGLQTGLDKTLVLMGLKDRTFGTQTFTIVTETPYRNVLLLAYNSGVFILGLVVITIGIAILLALLAANRITRPIQALVTVAEEIRKGDLSQQAATSGLTELDTLANTFNSMTTQLRQTLEGLEQRVAARTQALKTSAEVSRSLTTILDPDKLVTEVVDLVQSAFAYYHVNIYLLDETVNRLILAAGSGEAGQRMLANQYQLPKDQGLVGRAATTNSPILAPDVTKNPDWVSNPWLPDTKAELVVPIARGEQILGVLDIQHHTVDGLKQEDVDLMQSIANQLAVALINAQSFEQLVDEKLAEARQKEEAENRLEAYRRSPVGQAEVLANHLLSRPENSLAELHQLAQAAGQNSDVAALLSHLPKLMDDTQKNVGEKELHDVALLAKMAEGYNYLFSSQNAPELLLVGLRTLTKQLERPSSAGWEGSASTLLVYRLCQSAIEVQTISQITELDWKPVTENSNHNFPLASLVGTLDEFQTAIEALTAYERVSSLQDKLAYLVAAVERLRHIERQARVNLGTADVSIVLRIAETWQAIVARTLSELQTQARINCRLVTRHTLQNDVVTLMLNVRNEGRGAAINLKIKVLSGQEYTLMDETAELKQLAPGEEEQVVLYIRPRIQETMTQFRVRFVVFYDDPRGPNQTEHFADVVQLLNEQTDFQYIANPYIVGTPLEAGSSLFFGREDLLAAIEENLAAAHLNNLVLIGQRRMGKTSLLKQLRLRLDHSYIPVYLDGQVMGLDPGMTNFFLNLATEITFALEDQGVAMPQPNLEEFENSPASMFEHHFLAKTFQSIGQRHLLILFDEFEELEGAVRRGHLETSIFGYLRHLMQHIPNLSFIFCGTHRLEELAADYWNVLFNLSLYKRVGYFSLEEALRLIQKPVEPSGMRYDDLALDKMWRVTAGHPYFLQLLCHSLVNRHNKTERNYMTVADVNAALDEILSSGEAHFIYLWTESTSEEKMILTAISRMLPLTGSIQAVQVSDYLAERGVRLERRDIRDALHRLMLRDILKVEGLENGGESTYRWQLGLLGLWVEKYKSLGRVMDEVAL